MQHLSQFLVQHGTTKCCINRSLREICFGRLSYIAASCILTLVASKFLILVHADDELLLLGISEYNADAQVFGPIDRNS